MILRWLICFSVGLATSQGGTVTGRIQLTGTKIKDFSGVVVWLEPAVAQAAVAQPAVAVATHSVMKQKNKTFMPHILAITVGTTVDFPNFDPIFHNAFSSFDGKIFDVGLYPPGTSRSVRFEREGVVRVFCNIHPSMSAVIVVLKTPWSGISGSGGAFHIDGVPEGEYTVRVYHERATPATLAALARLVSIGKGQAELPAFSISETGYLPAPHKNKFGLDYPRDNVYAVHQP